VKHRRLLAALASAAAVLAGPARAADDSSAKASAALEEARQHAAKAKVHYDLGEFEKAAEEYILVYRLRPLPALLFNIAQSYRQGGQYEKARQFYKAYLREANDAKNKSAIEKAIREIDELLAKEKRAREVPPKGVAQAPVPGGPATSVTAGAPSAAAPQAPLPSPQGAERVTVADSNRSSTAVPAVAGPPAGTAALQAMAAPPRPPVPMEALSSSVQPSRGRSRTYAYISAGAAAVFVGAGLAFAAKASKYEDELNARPHPQSTIDDLSSTAKSSRTLAAICMGAGVVAAVGAGLFYFLPTGDGVAVQGRF
jgi:tetratricopeptide (TPR) repeat protein